MKCTVFDIARMLGVGEETVRRWIRDGKLKAERAVGRGGNSILLEDVISFVNDSALSYRPQLENWLRINNIAYSRVDAEGNEVKEAKSAVGSLLGMWREETIRALYPEKVDRLVLAENQEQDTENPDGNALPRTKDEILIKLREEQLKALKLSRQMTQLSEEMARISKEITLCNRRIEYYDLMLNEE